MILALRTDKPEAELYIYDGQKKLAEIKWQAHRELAETLNLQIEELLNKSSNSYNDLKGLVIYKGPGSFTGLRIGISVANALAYSLSIPIVATSSENWISEGLKKIQAGQNNEVAVPEYGSAANVTQPRK